MNLLETCSIVNRHTHGDQLQHASEAYRNLRCLSFPSSWSFRMEESSLSSLFTSSCRNEIQSLRTQLVCVRSACVMHRYLSLRLPGPWQPRGVAIVVPPDRSIYPYQAPPVKSTCSTSPLLQSTWQWRPCTLTFVPLCPFQQRSELQQNVLRAVGQKAISAQHFHVQCQFWVQVFYSLVHH